MKMIEKKVPETTAGESAESLISPTQRRLRLLIVHEHPVLCEALAVAIGVQGGSVDVVGCFPDVSSLVRADMALPDADVLLVGASHHLSEVKTNKVQLQARYPGIAVLVLGQQRPIQSGWQYTSISLRRHRSMPSLRRLLKRLQTIRPGPIQRAAAGRRPAQRISTESSGEWGSTLTRREREIAVLRKKGLSNKEIAAVLQIGIQTVKNHVHAVALKSQLANLTLRTSDCRSRNP
jgi:DNA-binding NarL/FixJ family response regulator